MSQFRRRLIISATMGGVTPPPVVEPIFSCKGGAKDGHALYATTFTPEQLGEFTAICICTTGVQGALMFGTATSTSAPAPYMQAYLNSGTVRCYYNLGSGRVNVTLATRFAIRYKNGSLYYKTPTKDWTLITASYSGDNNNIIFFNNTFINAYEGVLYDSASVPNSVIESYFTKAIDW